MEATYKWHITQAIKMQMYSPGNTNKGVGCVKVRCPFFFTENEQQSNKQQSGTNDRFFKIKTMPDCLAAQVDLYLTISQTVK